MKFNLKRPCSDCPFRKDVRFFLSLSRVKEIVRGITTEGRTFTCHKTLCKPERMRSHCAGALIMLERAGKSSQMMRIAERLGLYNRHELDMAAPVYDSPEQMIEEFKKHD